MSDDDLDEELEREIDAMFDVEERPKPKPKPAKQQKVNATYAADYLKAMDNLDLPPTVDHNDELDWVSAHPAMSRLDRSHKKGAKVLLSRKDVVSPPHGPAPSRRAVHMLQHWSNAPRDFHKMTLTKASRTTSTKSAATPFSEGEVEDDMEKQARVMAQYAVNKRESGEDATE